MSKLSRERDKIRITISLSKEVVEILNVFNNRSKLVDDILSSLLLNLSAAQMLELIKAMTNGDDVALFLIKNKCREFSSAGEVKTQTQTQTQQEQVKEQKEQKSVEKKPNINIQEFWG